MQPYTLPDGLDWFSIDMYHTDGPEPGWVDSHVRKFYEQQIYPNLTGHQKALLVPGAFGSNVNRYPNGTYVCNNTCYDEMCALDAAEFYQWAKEDPRIVAIAPWNYNGCVDCNGTHYNTFAIFANCTFFYFSFDNAQSWSLSLLSRSLLLLTHAAAVARVALDSAAYMLYVVSSHHYLYPSQFRSCSQQLRG